MDKKILITTWCTDDYRDLVGLDKLMNSVQYFHPGIEHIVIDTAATNSINEKYQWMRPIWMMAATCLPYINDYDMVVHLDGDCVVAGPMDEFFNCDADIIGVRNNNSYGKAGSHPGITITHLDPFGDGSQIPMQGFINAGLIGANSKEFWEDWHDVNEQSDKIKRGVDPYAHGIGDENDTLNQIFHCDRYTSKVIDEQGSGVSYGLSSCWGNDPRNHWESWSSIYVKDNGLYLDDPVTGETMRIKVMHQAGGGLAAELNKAAGGFRNWLSTVVSPEVNDYLEVVTRG